MAKQLSNQLGTLSSSPNDASCVDLNAMSMDSFRLWSTSALKVFLSIRGRKTEGSVDELVARAFIAWEDQLAVDPNKEHAMRLNLDEYKNRLKIKSRVLPDPFTISEGWLNEEGRLNWPSLYFSDICQYLKMRTSAELHHRLINEYKQGKSFRYFSCGFVKEVFYNPVSDTCAVAFLAAKVTPSMSLNSSPHEAWICLEKDSTYQPGGEIHKAYCTCTAGLNGCCNHVAAILFRVEYAVRTGMTKPSSTSEKC